MKKTRLTKKSIILYLAIILVCFSIINIYEAHRFTPEKWIAHPEKRNLIIADLLKKYELVGMTENEVVNLLGPETNGKNQTSFKGDSTYYPPEETLVYFIGTDLLEGEWIMLSLQEHRVVKISFGVT